MTDYGPCGEYTGPGVCTNCEKPLEDHGKRLYLDNGMLDVGIGLEYVDLAETWNGYQQPIVTREQFATWIGLNKHNDRNGRWGGVTWSTGTECRHCERTVEYVEGEGWVDPEATGDDSIWRHTCDQHDTFEAEHEAGTVLMHTCWDAEEGEEPEQWKSVGRTESGDDLYLIHGWVFVKGTAA